jgi:hypothetical protein
MQISCAEAGDSVPVNPWKRVYPWVSIGADAIVYANAISFDGPTRRNAFTPVRSIIVGIGPS